MMAEALRPHASCRGVVVVLLLCSLVLGVSSFPRQTIGKIPSWNLALDELGMRPGKILFNGKELDPHRSSSFLESDMSGMKELKEVETEWRHTQPFLQCGPLKMILKVMGPGASNLELDLGAGRKLRLSELPESCGYTLYQNARGLVLVVPYRGCNVIMENGYYVVPMIFLDSSITLICAISPTMTPKQQIPELPPNMDRSKREMEKYSLSHDPYLHYHNYLKYLYYLHIINNPRMYPSVQYVYNPLHPQHSDPQSYPYHRMHHPLYVNYQQNPAAPYCHPPGALCPLPHYFDQQPHKPSSWPKPTMSPTKRPPPSETTPAPTTWTYIPAKKLPPSVNVAPQTMPSHPPTTVAKRRCRHRTPPQDKTFTPYASSPFAQEILYDSGPNVVKPESVPRTAYNSRPLLGYQYWQNHPWFPEEEDEDLDWEEWDDAEP